MTPREPRRLPPVSIIIPARNDADALACTLAHLDRLPGIEHAEIIAAVAGDTAAVQRAAARRVRWLRP
jgi:glycosyltransferase involved in cell wall biosynthesis